MNVQNLLPPIDLKDYHPSFRRRLTGWFFVCLCCALAPAFGATEYFVGRGGDDTHDGRSREQAFATIQRGVEALAPGDTLTIGPGMYFENVEREGLGGPDADTTIRAEIPGTAVLRGDVDAPVFEKIEGYRFVYGAPLEEAPLAVLDHGELLVLRPKANLAELDFAPGFFYHDAEAGMLYLSNPDLTSPGARRYTLATSGKPGIKLISPQRVVIDGLAASGFFPEWGISLEAPESCVVRNCVLYLSVGGVVLGDSNNGGSNNLIENCVSYAHTFSGISRYGANNDIIRNNRTFRTKTEGKEHFGIMHYLRMKGPILIQNNLSWGQNFDYSVKPHEQDTLDRNVGLGFIRNRTMIHNLIGGGNEYDRSSNAPADNILFRREKDLDRNFEFADPLNLDFRLQPDSRFRGSAPDGSDRGPFPYEANIFYLSPEGDDSADGLSMRSPWKSLDRALRSLKPGDTLYLEAGRYASVDWKSAGDGKAPIRIRGRGRGAVVLAGPMELEGLKTVEWERLAFDGVVKVGKSQNLLFKNCTFFGDEGGLRLNGVSDAEITHSVFAKVPLDVTGSGGITLLGNLFAHEGAPAVKVDDIEGVLHSDFNSYQDGSVCWEVGGDSHSSEKQGWVQSLLSMVRKPAVSPAEGLRWSFDELQGLHDTHSLQLIPQWGTVDGMPVVANSEIFAGRGPHSTGIGIYHEYQVEGETLDLVGPFLHLVSDTTANFEWWTSQPATFDLAWGDSPATENVVRRVKGNERFNTFSLTDLQPGKTYYFRILAVEANPQDGVPSPPKLEPEEEPISFTTASAPAEPKTFYVAPDGDDSNPGTGRKQAFRTVNRAAALIGPGDTVLIAGGDYHETVRIRAAGTKDRPITFRALPGEKPVFQGEDLALAFDLNHKPYQHFDGLYFNFNMFQDGFALRHSRGVQFDRCFQIQIRAVDSPDLVVRNCVLIGVGGSILLTTSPGAVVENNVFTAVNRRQLRTEQQSLPLILRRNIFFDNDRGKTHQPLMVLPDGVEDRDNAYHLRWPEDERWLINERPITEILARRPLDSLIVNPMMPGAGGHRQGWMRRQGDDFNVFFSAHPELVKRGIGLQRSAFAEFPFANEPWLFDVPWAERVVAAREAADQLAAAGDPAGALQAYLAIQKDFPLPPLLESEILDAASRAAEETGDPDQAMKLAESIPIVPMALRRQMQIMLTRGQYRELVEKFSQKGMGGRTFDGSFEYPETEELMEELFALRAEALIKTGDLEAAEKDLRVMNDKRQQMKYRSGESIHDRVALRLGRFYRDVLKDEDRALEEFRHVIDRTTWTFWGRPLKPAARGADQTLIDASREAAAILRQRGQNQEAEQIEFDLLLAQAEAAAAVLDYPTLVDRFRQMLDQPGKVTAAITANAGRLQELTPGARSAAIQSMTALVEGLRPDTVSALQDQAGSDNTADRETATLGLLLFVPEQDKVGELFEQAKKQGQQAAGPLNHQGPTSEALELLQKSRFTGKHVLSRLLIS
jgi:hypothetical protein